MHPAHRLLAGILAAASTAQGALAVEGNGLTASADAASWSRWQGRVAFTGSLAPWQPGFDRSAATGLKVDSISLLGDFYFGRSLVGYGNRGGFRTTGGLVHGSRAQLATSRLLIASQGGPLPTDRHAVGGVDGFGAESGFETTTTVPYVGVGYSGLSVKGGWRFNADLGMMGQARGQGIKLGRALSANQALDEQLREMRLSPLLQFSVSYSF